MDKKISIIQKLFVSLHRRCKRIIMVVIKDIFGNVLEVVNEDDLDYALLDYREFQYADLRGLNMCFADLSNTDLTGANLSGTDLRYAKMAGAILDDIITDEYTILPAKRHHLSFC